MNVHKTFQKGRRLLLCVVLVCFYTACRKSNLLSQPVMPVKPVDTPLAVPFPVTTEAVMLNRHYGDDTMQVMDIYLPAGRSVERTSLMIFIHGGGWMGGDKADFAPACENLLKNPDFSPDFAYININYRLVKPGDAGNQWPAAEDDIVKALDFLWEHTNEYQVARRASLIGTSAGGQLATLVGYKHNEKQFIRVIASTWGPYDIQQFYKTGCAGVPEMMVMVTGYTPAENPVVYDRGSSLRYVTAGSPPTFLAHGTLDTLVRVAQGKSLDSVLTKNKVPHVFYTFEGYHCYPSEEVAVDGAAKMFDFIREYIKGR